MKEGNTPLSSLYTLLEETTMKEQAKWTWHYPGDGTERGEQLNDVILQVVVERAKEGYTNEIEYCERNNIAF